ncbi:MAG: D-glycero-beta-D-manno-heptose-7-phosphate kinase [Cytophagales bacterium]|nr:D-glycero-beta-D-manno-heptose-7-phosphate kinase [Cytophagales bacterium]
MVLSRIFEDFNKLRVLIVGDVMIDSYLMGKVDRISPEAPVPIVQVTSRDKRLGGAANVALNIQAMGATPLLCAVIGEDGDAQDFLQLLDKNQLKNEGIVQSNERVTTIKHRIISGAHQMLRVDAEDTKSLSETEEEKFLERVEKLLPTCDVVIFEDYDKGVLTQSNIQEIIQLAKKYNKPTVVDPKKQNFLNYQGATLFKPNLKELKEGLNIEFNPKSLEEINKAVAQLKKELQIEKALITLSELGMYVDDDQNSHVVPAHVRTISDVSGAGDTVISVTAVCMGLGLPISFTVQLANLAGGLVCESVGVVPIDKLRLLSEAGKFKLEKML